jgi:hypothetical protein
LKGYSFPIKLYYHFHYLNKREREKKKKKRNMSPYAASRWWNYGKKRKISSLLITGNTGRLWAQCQLGQKATVLTTGPTSEIYVVVAPNKGTTQELR